MKISLILKKYDNNSFLSGYMQQIVSDVFEVDLEDESIVRHLLDDCQILEKFCDAWELNSEDEKQGKPRKGYMGHLYNILKIIFGLADASQESEQGEPKQVHPPHVLLRKKVLIFKISPLNFSSRIF